MMQTVQTEAIALQRTDTAQILHLRHQVLRPGHAIAEVMFAEDQDPSSHHYGAFDPAGDNICCLSLLPSQWKSQAAWRLRAMATAKDYRNQGIGSRLMRFAIASLEDDGESRPIWCNSRVSSTGFYQRFGLWRYQSHSLMAMQAHQSKWCARDRGDRWSFVVGGDRTHRINPTAH